MQLTINFPGVLPNEKLSRYIQQIESMFRIEGITVEIRQQTVSNPDAWDELNPDEIAVNTGITDFAEQHDHYLYGTPKRV
jgi:hypothetical protein